MNGPQIRQFLRDDRFTESMEEREKDAWLGFKEVVENFLGNNKAENYKEIVENMAQKYRALGCLMSLKVHLIRDHIDHFPENLGEYSEEQRVKGFTKT